MKDAQFLVLVLIIVLLAGVQGCGWYASVTRMIPERENGWVVARAPIGLAIDSVSVFSCNDKSISLETPIVYSRTIAAGPLYVPVPLLDNKKPEPSLKDPVILIVRINSPHVKTCDANLFELTADSLRDKKVTLKSIKVSPNNGLHEYHVDDYHDCIFEAPPAQEIGDTFKLSFSSSLLDCDVSPLNFKKHESIEYVSTPVSM